MGPNPIPVCPYGKRKSEHGADTEGRQYEVTQGECHVKTEDGMTHLQAKEPEYRQITRSQEEGRNNFPSGFRGTFALLTP